jgi:hypothetical protein
MQAGTKPPVPISFIIWEKRGDVKRRKLKKNIVISENEP